MSEGPFDMVGWGPFALPGERKRLREAEERRTDKINARAKERRMSDSYTIFWVIGPTGRTTEMPPEAIQSLLNIKAIEYKETIRREGIKFTHIYKIASEASNAGNS